VYRRDGRLMRSCATTGTARLDGGALSIEDRGAECAGAQDFPAGPGHVQARGGRGRRLHGPERREEDVAHAVHVHGKGLAGGRGGRRGNRHLRGNARRPFADA
jgi:hypothetical protein